MTIEIKQLIIRAIVEDARARPFETIALGSRAAPLPAQPTMPSAAGVDLEVIVAACTRQVLRELRKGRGR